MMERLTIKSNALNSIFFKDNSIIDGEKKTDIIGICEMGYYEADLAMKKLCEYEDLGITPEQVIEMSRLYQEKCEEVARIEKRLENAVELPCKVGDVVFKVIKSSNEIAELKIGTIFIIEKRITINANYIWKGTCGLYSFDCSDIGRIIFLSREEAENKLKELEEKHE